MHSPCNCQLRNLHLSRSSVVAFENWWNANDAPISTNDEMGVVFLHYPFTTHQLLYNYTTSSETGRNFFTASSSPPWHGKTWSSPRLSPSLKNRAADAHSYRSWLQRSWDQLALDIPQWPHPWRDDKVDGYCPEKTREVSKQKK